MHQSYYFLLVLDEDEGFDSAVSDFELHYAEAFCTDGNTYWSPEALYSKSGKVEIHPKWESAQSVLERPGGKWVDETFESISKYLKEMYQLPEGVAIVEHVREKLITLTMNPIESDWRLRHQLENLAALLEIHEFSPILPFCQSFTSPYGDISTFDLRPCQWAEDREEGLAILVVDIHT